MSDNVITHLYGSHSCDGQDFFAALVVFRRKELFYWSESANKSARATHHPGHIDFDWTFRHFLANDRQPSIFSNHASISQAL